MTVRLHLTHAARLARPSLLLLILLTGGCSNNPYEPGLTERPVIFRALTAEPRSLDPSFAYTIGEGLVIDQICPSYYKYHYLKRPLKLELALGAKEAERRPFTINQDGKLIRGEEWTFTLKRGVHFQDDPCFPGGKGREVVAADIAYAFQRMADPKVKSPMYGFMVDKLLGFAAASDAARKSGTFDYSRPMEGLVLDPQDRHTFRVRLNQPYPQLRYLMALHFTTAIPREAVAFYGGEFKRHPVGCGAYRLKELTRKQRIVLEANPNGLVETYPSEGEPGDAEKGLLKDVGLRLPRAQELVFIIQKETITGWSLFQQGYIDSWNVTPESFRQAVSQTGTATEEMKRRGVKLSITPDAGTAFYSFNMKDPVVGGYTPERRKLRQAISLAYDSREYIDLFTQGHGIPAQTYVPPGIPGYEESYRNPYRQFDPKLTLAKRLLAEAGYPGGIDPKSGERLTLYYDSSASDAGDRQEVALLVKHLQRLGVRVETRFWRDIVLQDRIDTGGFQMVAGSWYADYPDPENMLFLLYGPNRRPGPNTSGYDNPEYNRLFEQMRAMEDGPERMAIIRQMRKVAEEDCPVIPRLHTVTLMLAYDWHTNVKPHPVANDWLKYRGIDGPRRAARQREWNRPVYWPLTLAALLMVGVAVPAAYAVRQRQRRKLRSGRSSEAAASSHPNPRKLKS